MNRTTYFQLFFTCAFLIHELITFGNFDVHRLISGGWRQGNVMVDELTPSRKQHVEA